MARKIEVQIVGDARSLQRAFGQAQTGSSGLSRAFKALGAAAAGGVVVGFGMAVKSAIDFDREMRNVNSIAKLGEARFQGLSKQVLKLARESGQAPKTLAKGLYDIVSSGFDANEAVTILRASAKAATAGLTDTATATKAVSAALNAYHRPATDARKVSDVLFQTVNKGVLTFEELAQNMGDIVPAAAPLGISLEEVAAAVATITLQGVPAAEAATRVKNSMLQLASPSKALSALLKKNGFESAEAAIKAEGYAGVLEIVNKETGGNVTATSKLMPEIRALMGIVGLTGKNFGTYTENLDAMNRASEGAGATAAAFAEQGKSIAFQWQKAKASLIAAAIPVGQLLFPLLAQGAEKVGDFASRIQREMPMIRREFGDLASVAGVASRGLFDFARSAEGMSLIVGGTAALATGKLFLGIQSLVATLGMMGGPFGLAIASVGLLAGGSLYLYLQTHKASEELRALLRAAGDLDKGLSEARQSEIDYASSITTAKAAQLELERATRSRASALRDAGRDSDAYRDAQIRVERAEQAVAQATVDSERVQRKRKDAQEAIRRGSRELAAALKGVSDAEHVTAKSAADVYTRHGDLIPLFHRVKQATGSEAQALAAVNRELAKKHPREFAAALAPLIDRMASGAVKTTAFARATAALAVALGRLPTRKEVNIIVREEVRTKRLAQRGIGGPAPGRAAGGFVPAPEGAPTLIEAHGGEIILNPRQQEVLGGPRFLAELFGFTGSEGPSFAGGGRVKPPTPAQRLAAKKKAGREADAKLRREKERKRKAKEAAAAKHAGRVSPDLPASIEEAIILAEDTPDRADDIAAYVRAEKLLVTRLGRAKTAAERVPLRRALQDVREKLVELRKPPEAEEAEEAEESEAERSRREAETANLQAQLAQSQGRLSAAERAFQLQTAALGAGVFGGTGAPQVILQSLVAPTDAMMAHAGRVVAEAFASQSHRSPTLKSVGL